VIALHAVKRARPRAILRRQFEALKGRRKAPRTASARVGEAGVFITTNALSAGAASTATETWHRLWDSGSMACEPGIPFFASDTPLGRSLYVPCHGRSLLSFLGIPLAGALGYPVVCDTAARYRGPGCAAPVRSPLANPVRVA
jgi:hypothetical protein